MNNKIKKTGVVLAAAAAVAFATAPVTSAVASPQHVKCVGGNACKGKSMCKTAENMCKGHNSCKGKGFVMAKSKKECTHLKDKMKKMHKHM